jgi:serine/threonine protein kinase
LQLCVNNLQILKELKHESASEPIQHIYNSPNRLVYLQPHQKNQKLFPYICKQKQYLSENQVMQVAKQLLEVLIYAKSLGLSHCRLDSDCIYVSNLDFRNDKIEI